MYVVTFVVFLVLSERLEQDTSKHVCNVFWNIKTVEVNEIPNLVPRSLVDEAKGEIWPQLSR